MSEAEVEAIVDRLADIAAVLHDANPHDKAEVFRQLGLKLTYHPGRKIVEARVEPVEFGFPMVSEDRGLPIAHASGIALTTAFVLGDAR
jgi:hypothetical protein